MAERRNEPQLASPQSLSLKCVGCERQVTLSYTPTPKSTATTFFCPYCHKVNRLDVPGAIRGVSRASEDKS